MDDAYCDCGSKLIVISDSEAVQYWEKAIERRRKRKKSSAGVMGFTKIGSNLVRVTFYSPKVVERWKKDRDCSLGRYSRYKKCPECFDRFLKERGIRKE